VLAVVRQDAVVPLTEARAGSPYDFFGEKPAPRLANAYTVATGKFRERNLFHRTPSKTAGESGVVDNPAGADVDALVNVEAARRDEMCCHRRQFAVGEQTLAERFESIVRTPVHGWRRYGAHAMKLSGNGRRSV
jgi:hypothetical protein